MSISLLGDLYNDVRRLIIAGSATAPNDFRLKKHVQPLTKAGEKAPIFAKLAKMTEEVVNADERTAGAALLELGALINAIRYTQGTTGAEGKLTQIKSSGIKISSEPVSARVLKPLIEALTSTGGGRLELIRDAFNLGHFSDFRTVRPALQALDDKSFEVRNFVADNVIVKFGEFVYEDVERTFKIDGGSNDSKKLQILHRLNPERTREILLKAVDEGAKEVKVGAISCLGLQAEDIEFLKASTKAKNKEVRAAAIQALNQSDQPEAITLLTGLIQSDQLESVAVSLNESTLHEKLVSVVNPMLRKQIELLIAEKDKKKLKAVAEMANYLTMLSSSRSTPATDQLLMDVLEQSDALSKVGALIEDRTLLQLIFEYLESSSETTRRYLIEHGERLPVEAWDRVIVASLQSLTPQEFYDSFSRYFNLPKGAKKLERERSQHLANILENPYRAHRFGYDADAARSLYDGLSYDPRWCEIVDKAELPYFAGRLASHQTPAIQAYMLGQFKKAAGAKNKYNQSRIAQDLVRSGHPEAESLVLAEVGNLLQSKRAYDTWGWMQAVGLLSPSAIPQLEAFAADSKTTEAISNAIVEAIDEIRMKAAK